MKDTCNYFSEKIDSRRMIIARDKTRRRYSETRIIKEMKRVDEAVTINGLFFVVCVRGVHGFIGFKNMMITNMILNLACYDFLYDLQCNMFQKVFVFELFLACYVWKIFLRNHMLLYSFCCFHQLQIALVEES